MTVRRATVDDAVGIARVHTLSWQVAYRGVVPDSVLDGLDVERRASGWRRHVESGDVFVAVVDESVVGFLACGPARDVSDTWELYAIYLTPSAWGSGAADSLMAVLPNRTTVLWVLADNPRARRFYERHGFVLDGVTRVETMGGRELAEVRYARGAA